MDSLDSRDEPHIRFPVQDRVVNVGGNALKTNSGCHGLSVQSAIFFVSLSRASRVSTVV
jgi:hypothetical protein